MIYAYITSVTLNKFCIHSCISNKSNQLMKYPSTFVSNKFIYFSLKEMPRIPGAVTFFSAPGKLLAPLLFLTFPAALRKLLTWGEAIKYRLTRYSDTSKCPTSNGAAQSYTLSACPWQA